MANPLARTIMNNISKKSRNKKIEEKLEKYTDDKCIKNINEKEENILKNILYKNKVSLNSLNSINEIKKNINSKTIIQEKSSQKNSINDLLNKSNNKTNEPFSKTKPKIKTQSLKSLNLNSKCEENIKKHTSEKQIKKITSLRDLAK
ncbi:hypothetical protein [Romboutsia lituseburensis]|uniref:hypothetical protein n=1 Tax=Romboutsia lituseburensis TaxID=1537 RepID=UPI00215AE681|nr:hypothetical protein [Romboutsia lituseburensis]MCR8744553.1 hypothetical protein [Romboutsia lituseburensis]